MLKLLNSIPLTTSVPVLVTAELSMRPVESAAATNDKTVISYSYLLSFVSR